VYVVVALFLALRFARFCVPAVRSQVAWLEEWHTYAERVVAEQPRPAGGVLVLDPPPDPIESQFLGAMVRWLYQDPNLGVAIR